MIEESGALTADVPLVRAVLVLRSRHHGPPPGVDTAEEIRALGLLTDVPTVGQIFDIGRGLAYHLARDDRFPAPVIKLHVRYLVPVAGILHVLGIPADGDRLPSLGSQR